MFYMEFLPFFIFKLIYAWGNNDIKLRPALNNATENVVAQLTLFAF